MRAHLVLGSLAISLLACTTSCIVQETRSPMMQRTSADGPAPVSSSRAKLEAIVVESSGPNLDDDACVSGTVSYAVDREEGLARLEQLMDYFSKEKQLDTRDQVLCFPDLARRRIVWLWRNHRLDVARELTHPIAHARAAAIGLLAHAHAGKPQIREMLDDPDFEVRVMTYYAIIDEKDEGAVPKLDAVAARSEIGSPDRKWACSALASFGKKDRCPEWKDHKGGLELRGPNVDPCARMEKQLHSTVPDERFQGMWSYIVDLRDPISNLDLRMRTKTKRATCPIDEAAVETILARNGRDELTALAAAYRLLRALGPLPETPEELARGFAVNAPKPKTF